MLEGFDSTIFYFRLVKCTFDLEGELNFTILLTVRLYVKENVSIWPNAVKRLLLRSEVAKAFLGGNFTTTF